MQMNSLPIQVDHMGTGAFILLVALYLFFTGQMEGVGFLCSFVVRFVGVIIMRRVQDYRREAKIHMMVFLVVHALHAYSWLLLKMISFEPGASH